MWIWWLVPFAQQRPVPQHDNRQAVFGLRKSDCALPPSVFTRFSTCWLLFVLKSEIPLEGASLWLDFGHPESRDKYIKHHCKRRLLQRHPEAVWPCKSLCTVRRDVCRKLINKSVISSTQILFIMPVLKLSRRTVYSKVVLRNWPILQYLLWCICRSTYRKSLYRLKAKNNFSTWTTLWKISFADVDSK